MSLAGTIADDWQHIDGVENVTLKRGSTTLAAEAKGLRRAVRRPQIVVVGGAIGHASVQETVWHLWASTLGGAEPEQTDVIEEAGGRAWIVQEVSIETLGTRYRCRCTKRH